MRPHVRWTSDNSRQRDDGLSGEMRATPSATNTEASDVRRKRMSEPGHQRRRLGQTFSNGTSIFVRFSSQAGTGRFFERMNSGLNSFDR